MQTPDDTERAKERFFSGLAAFDARDYSAAEEQFRAALAIVPGRLSALVNLATALFRQEKLTEAITVARQALAVDPNDVDALIALGSALAKSGEPAGGLDAMERAVAAAPGKPAPLVGRALVAMKLKEYDRAISDYESARRLGSPREDLLSLLVTARINACDWRDLDQEVEALLAGVRTGRATADPFWLLPIASTAADQLTCATATVARDYPPLAPLYRGERYCHDRVRLAYLSGDFYKHPTAYLANRMMELHDRDRFEVFAFSYGPDDASETRQRSMDAVEHFLDFRDAGNDTIADAVRTHEIDVAVDLGAFTTGGRLPTFARRPAPIQVSYLGYPGTSGAPYIDYILADETIIPPEMRRYYSEKVAALPHCYQATDDTRPIGETPTRAACGLPENGFVFCCFNNSYKITPETFEVWMRILAAVPDSVLWLVSRTSIISDNLRREATARGINPKRLILADVLPPAEHLARHRLADLFLDTWPYNAHTTASDALWAGLPIVTLMGQTFPSRVAASILRANGLPELVTGSVAEYESLAVSLARDPARLAALKAKVLGNRGAAPLFQTARFTRHIEAAYVTMVERHRRGEAPEHFTVSNVLS